MMRISLRVRLAVVVAALIALVTVAVGLAAGLSLQSALVGDLDQDLHGATTRAVRALSGGPPQPGTAVAIPGQTPGTLAALIDGGSTLAAVLDANGGSVALDDDELVSLWNALSSRQVGEVFTATVDGVGSYRLTTVALDSRILVIGLPIDEVDETVSRLWLTASIIGGGVVVLGAVVGWLFGTTWQRVLARVQASLAAREAGEDRLRRFVSDASHELRTPLASIRGYSELIRRSGARLRKDVAHSVDRIESESIRMTGLVEDLLLLARLDESEAAAREAARAEVTAVAREPIDLVGVVVDAVSDAQASAPDHDWSVEAPDALEVHGDAARLHQAVMNLLANAARHTPAGTSVVTRVGVEGERAVIEVVDDGPGIDAELLPDVFGRFVRGDASRSRVAGSTGLGLAIVEAIARAHGGEASVTSEPGRTAFRIAMPIA